MSLRRLLPLFLLLALSSTLMTYQSNRGVITPLNFLSVPLNRLNEAIHSAASSVKEPFRKIMLRDEENKKLREEINRLHLEREKSRDVLFENQRLREILSLKEKENRYVATARIISKGIDRWSNILVISKGKRDGITKDMAVITPLGLVGKISMVNDYYASVLLITDINFSAAVRIQETRKEAILSGTGTGRCILKYVPDEEAVKEGEVIITSGFDDLFPQELIIGYVSRVSKKGAGIFQQIEVAPSQDPTKLDEVMIIRR